MTMTTIRQFLQTTRATVTNNRALGSFAALYALLLASLYGFIATREANVRQVTVRLLLLVLVPLEFFLLQSAILYYARVPKIRRAQILPNASKRPSVNLAVCLLEWALYA